MAGLLYGKMVNSQLGCSLSRLHQPKQVIPMCVLGVGWGWHSLQPAEGTPPITCLPCVYLRIIFPVCVGVQCVLCVLRCFKKSHAMYSTYCVFLCGQALSSTSAIVQPHLQRVTQ